jgi:hypothetical protein
MLELTTKAIKEEDIPELIKDLVERLRLKNCKGEGERKCRSNHS